MRIYENGLTKLQKTLISVISFALVTFLILYKCKFGFGNIDEGFYLSTAYRLVQGDALFKNEWHVSQISATLLIPFVYLYKTLFGSTQGIILVFRYLYVVIHTVVSIFLFLRLKRYSFIGSLISTLCFLTFAPSGIMALSYISMGIDSLAISLVLLLNIEKKIKIQCFLSGIFFAFAVLCCPFLVILYIVIGVATLTSYCIKKQGILSELLKPEKFLFLTIGAATIATLFLAFIFSRCTLSDIIANIPNILNDPAHEFKFYKFTSFFTGIIKSNGVYSYVILALLSILLVILLIDKERKQHKCVYVSALCLLTVIYLLSFLLKNSYINYYQFPITLIAPFLLMLSDNRKLKYVFNGLWFPGIIATFCYHLSSNQRFHMISAVSIISSMASIIMLSILLYEIVHDGSVIKIWKRMAVFAIILAFLVQLFTEIYVRYTFIYWDVSMQEQEYKIDNGCEKGIFVSESNFKSYTKIYGDLEKINDDETTESVFFIKGLSLFYLDCYKKRNASFSSTAWSYEPGYEYDQSVDYYFKHNNKLPDLVYYVKSDLNLMDWDEDDFNRYHENIFMNYEKQYTDNGILLIKR